jgi:predicted nucleotidyltransferase
MKKTFDKIVRYITHVAKPEKIILFGSFAHGSNNVHSDIDLLVITDQNFGKKEIEDRISNYIKEFSMKADVLVRTQQETEQEQLKKYSFIRLIIDDGKILYERQKNT